MGLQRTAVGVRTRPQSPFAGLRLTTNSNGVDYGPSSAVLMCIIDSFNLFVGG